MAAKKRPAQPKPRAPKKKRPKSGGRKAGTPNKLTVAVKEAVLGALNEVGGQQYLVKIARQDPKAFCALLGRLIPTEVKSEHTGKDGQPIEQTLTVVVKRDRNFFGRGPAPGADAPPDPDPPKPGSIQDGGVRPPVG